ncbi:hypothetical protein [Curtobacterium flaccumfaciens]|uniref:hypothetical protein n=1 Tax=Curtobacterium flaccumfaciens TaxID=2035 RepID=UPI003879066C
MDKLTNRLIASRVRGGANEAQSVALLADLIRSHEGGNLAYALEYNGFTPAGRGQAAVEMLSQRV